MFFKKKNIFLYSSELQLEFLTVASGKSKIISELMWMRNNEISRIDSRADVPIEVWWYNKKNENEKISFLQNMKKACNDLSTNQNFVINEKTIANLFEVHIKKILDYNNKNLFRKTLNLLPKKLQLNYLNSLKNVLELRLEIKLNRGNKYTQSRRCFSQFRRTKQCNINSSGPKNTS